MSFQWKDPYDSESAGTGTAWVDPYDAEPAERAETDGLSGALYSGVERTLGALRSTWDAYTGDAAGVEQEAVDAQGIAQTPEQRAFSEEVRRRSAGNGDESVWQGIKNVAGAVAEEPLGALHEVAAQLPNSAVTLGGMYAGAKLGAAAGSFAGPAGTVIGTFAGGLIGMFAGNTAVETGYIAQDKAQDGAVTDEELSAARGEGATKGGVITAVDAATLGLNRWIGGGAGRAVEQAITKTLTDRGVDVANEAAVKAALSSRDVARAATEAGAQAFQEATTAGKQVARGTAKFTLETAGEGVGEYAGSAAAGQDASFTEAALESLLSVPQSVTEMRVAKKLEEPGRLTGLVNRAANMPAVPGPPPTQPLSDLPITERAAAQKAAADQAQAEAERLTTSLGAAPIKPIPNQVFDIPPTGMRRPGVIDYTPPELSTSPGAAPERADAAEPGIPFAPSTPSPFTTETPAEAERRVRSQQPAGALPQKGPDPMLVMRDGTTARASEIDAEIARLESSGQAEDAANLRARIAGYPGGQSSQTTPAAAETPAQILQKNGKPYTTLKAAQLALRARKDVDLTDYNPVEVEGGFALVRGAAPIATPPAAPRLTREQIKQRDRNVDSKADDLLAAIAKSGGISRAEAEAQGIDPAEFRRRGHKIKLVFTQNGDSFDGMAERLAQHGYPVTDEQGNYSPNVLLDRLLGSLAGNRVTSAAGTEAELDRQAQDREEPVASGPESLDEALAASGSSEFLDELALVGDDMGADADTADLADAIARAQEIIGEDAVEAILERAAVQAEDAGYADLAITLLETATHEAKPTEAGAGRAGDGGGSQAQAEDAQETRVTAEERRALTADRRQKKRPFPKSQERRQSDRRQDTETRKRVDEMTPEEMRHALLTDPLTGLGNRRAYDESEKMPFQVAIDLDGLKFVNDTYGHDAGDQFIAEFGAAVQAITGDGYHLSGDEFMVQAINESAAIRIMREIEAAAADIEIAVTITKTGEEATVNGVHFSYGIGQDKAAADKRLYEHKDERKRAGIRKDREPDDGGPVEAPPAAQVQGSAQEEEVAQTPPQSGVSASGAIDTRKLAEEAKATQARWDVANARADKIGNAAAKAAQERFENGDIEVDEFERLLDAAETKPAAPRDLLGDAPVKEQALADAKREKDAKRNGRRDVPMDAPPGTLFNQGQQDIEDAQPEPAPAPKAEESLEARRARMDLDAALADLGSILLDRNSLQVVPNVDEAKLLPVLTRVLDAAFRLGYHKFKDAARFALNTIREKFGAEAADAVTLDHLQGAYIGMAGKYQDQGADTKKAVVAVDSLAELESTDERASTGGEGQEALGGMAAEPDAGTQGGRDLFAGDAESSRTGAGADSRPDAGGVSGTRGGRSGAQGTHPAGSRTRSGGQRGRSGRTGANGSRVSELGAADVQPGSGPVSPPNIPASNFAITEDVRLGQGGEVEKFRDNLAAIRTLKQIQAENRRATPEEQRTLARYVGWGGLANAFADNDGNFKKGWEDRGRELADLLTPKELAAARSSTRNAHYTSEPIIRGMWDAVRRLGYRGGLALESSAGVGNFLGLAPQDITSRFIAVEYDAITAGIAKALYPQDTVLHSGFQKVPLADQAFDLAIGNPPFGNESLNFQFKPELRGKSIHNQFFLASLDALKTDGILAMVVSRYLLDAKDSSARLALAKKADLIGAIRLPDTAFKENARTEVVTDIIFLKKKHEFSEADRFDAAGNKMPAIKFDPPSWVDTTTIPDPLGGDPIVVNRYFAENPAMILGSLERSGSMRYENDITVRLDKSESIAERLAAAVNRLPKDIINPSQDVIDRSLARHQSMTDALEIALSGAEEGAILRTAGGGLDQVLERETPEGDYELTKRPLTADSPWSPTLAMDKDGHWYREVQKLDDKGKPVKAGRMNVYEREVFASEKDIPASLLLGQAKFERLQSLVELRDLLKAQLQMEAEDVPAKQMEANRKKLAAAYRAFVDKHGPVNAAKNASLVAEMPDGALVLALEMSYRKEQKEWTGKVKGKLKLYNVTRKESATPAPILKERVVRPYEAPTKAESPADALAISLSESGRVDIDRIADLLGTTPEGVVRDLYEERDNPLIFHNPESGEWETRSTYLTGQVKRKLNAARERGLQKHVAALEQVQPKPIGAENISVGMGMAWVPADIYADFINSLTGGSKAKVQFSALTNSYNVSGESTTKAKEWGTDWVSLTDLVDDILNNRQTKVYAKDSDGKRFLLQDQTDLANLKKDQVRTAFEDWVFQDGNRRNRLVEIFNEKFNTRVARQHDGSHLTMPGKVPDAVIRMRRHQKNAIWRGIAERFMLIDHAVGAGKTFTAIGRAMERRRMGLSRKPMIVVPNHMVDQFATDVYRLYPSAKVLAVGKKDLERKKRRKAFAKIATGDWDVVIMPHSSFGFIQIAPETEERYIEAEIALAEAAIKEAEEQAEEDGATGGRFKPFNVKEAERVKAALEARLDKIRAKGKDRLLTFEQMGVDDLTVDEAHEFKNLFYNSRTSGVRGMGDKSGSQKAFDLYNKIRTLRETPTGTVTFMTGTPISNSAVEMYTMMRYLAADELSELGLEHFDAWRSQYVGISTKYEPTESGSLKEVNRLGRYWSNMRSLMDLYYSFTDAVTNDDIKKAYAEDHPGKEFPLPKVAGGGRQSVVIKPTPAQEAALKDIIAGFEGLDGISDHIERNAARLRLMDRARKVSLDVRAVDPRNPSDEAGGKLERVADEVAALHRKWNADRGTQLIFLDRSIPKSKGDDKIIREYDDLVAKRDQALVDNDEDAYRRAVERLEKFDSNEINELRNAQNGGWNAYQQIKDNLIARGIPAEQIRFIQEANTDAQKQALFDSVNDGEVRVLIGSTPRMGAGTNVQKRLVGLHHVDVTWKPSDIEQREGRIIRQGNLFNTEPEPGKPNPLYRPDFEVVINAYATERTVDAKMWDLNATKLKMINGIRHYDGSFNMEFDDEDSVSMAEIAALATGDPMMLERVTLMGEIQKLELLESAHRRKMYGIQDSVAGYERDIAELPGQIERAREQARRLREAIDAVKAESDARRVTIEGKEYSDDFAANRAMLEAIEKQKTGNESGKYAVSVNGARLSNKADIEAAIKSSLGDPGVSVTVDGKQYIELQSAGREIAAKIAEATDSMTQSNKRIPSTKVGEIYGMAIEFDAHLVTLGKPRYDMSLSVVDDGAVVATANFDLREDGKPTATLVRNRLHDLTVALAGKAEGISVRGMERRLATAREDLPELKAKMGQTFDKADELKAKRDRLEQVTQALAGKGQSDRPAYTGQDAILGQGTYDLTTDKFSGVGRWHLYTLGMWSFSNTPENGWETEEEARAWMKEHTVEKGPDALYSRMASDDTLENPSRRRFVMGAAAVMAAVPVASVYKNDVALGKAQAISETVLRQKVSSAAEKILRGNGATQIDGSKRIREALADIVENGPKEVRQLARKIRDLMPEDGLLLTVDDDSLVNAHGVVDLEPIPHLTLFTAEGRQGLTLGTFLHETLHAAVAARYRTLSVGVVRSNDAKLNMAAPAAADALEQFRSLWREFRDVQRLNAPGKDAELSVTEAFNDPDEFFVRALTDAPFQRYLAGIEYKGKTLFQRFKDWVKSALLGLRQSGTTPSWLDAALAASDDLIEGMGRDTADFSRMKAIAAFNRGDRMKSAMYARTKAPAEPASPYADLNRRIREEHVTAWDKARTWLKRQLSPGGLLPDAVFREKIKRDSEFEVIEFDVAHLVGQLERAVKADYGTKAGRLDETVQRLLSEVMAGNVAQDVPERTKVVLLAMRQYIDRLSMQYAAQLQAQANQAIAESERLREEQRALSEERNALEDTEENEDTRAELLAEIRSKVARANAKQAEAMSRVDSLQTILNNLGEYVNRSYRAFDDKDWARKVPDKVLDDARAYLLERYAEDGMDETEAARRAEVVLNEILKHGTAYESMDAFIQESKLGAKDLSILKRRKQIAPQIRALLGEYTDPRITFAKSATKMGRLIWNQTFLDRVLEIGTGTFLWTDATKPPEATVQIAADGSETYAPLNGLWTTPEINQAFKDALGKEQMADWYRTIVQLNGFVKYGKTVLSPTTAARNWMSAFFFSVANGHFDMRHMAKSVQGLREYFTQNGDAAKLAYLRKLKHLGVVYDTPYAGEMMRLLEDSRVADKLVMGKGRFDFKQGLDLATKFYQYGDDFWKIIGFENEKRQWMKSGLPEAEAEVRAAERVRNTYPTYSMVGRGIQSLRRFPLAGTFVSFPAEIIRTTGNMLRYLAADMKDPQTRPMAMRRAAGLAIASGFAYGLQALSMALLGMDDDDDEAVRRMAAPWQRNSNLIYTGRDADGNIRYLDVSFLDPYNYWKRPIMAIMRNQPWEDSARDVAKETLTPFLGVDIAAGAIFEVLANKKESGAPVYNEYDEVLNQTADIANHLRKTLQPGVASNLERTWKALDGEVSPSGRKYDIQDEAAAWVGFRMSTLDPKVALYYRSFDFKDAKAEADKKIRDAIRKERNVSSGDLRDAWRLNRRLRENAYREMALLVSAAQKAGMSRSEIMAVLKNSGVSGDDRVAILNGKVPMYRPSDRVIKEQAEKARTTFGADAYRETIRRYREVLSYGTP